MNQQQQEKRQKSESMLSIIVDDFDSKEKPNENQKSVKTPDDCIKKILDEVEHRKDEFRKLLEEHNAVIQNLKKIEKNDDENVQKDEKAISIS